jgi:hypothetical protein
MGAARARLPESGERRGGEQAGEVEGGGVGVGGQEQQSQAVGWSAKATEGPAQ